MGRKRRSAQFKNNSQVIDMEEARRLRQERRQAEKDKEEEKLRYAASQQTRGKMAIRRSRTRRRVVIGVIAVVVMVMIAASLINIISLKREQYEVMQQAKKLQNEKEELERELSEINDPANVEQQARNQLRLIKPGEKLYMFPEEMNKIANQEDLQQE